MTVKITLTDPEGYGHEQEIWAENNCPSFFRREVLDVSDVSMYYDSFVDYYFYDEKDAILFKLKFGGN